jgi:hypothetical protein
MSGHRHWLLLELHQPPANAVASTASRKHLALCALNQQREQVVVASLGDAPQTGLGASGVLDRHHTQPSTELPRVGELLEVAYAGFPFRSD